MKLQHHGQEVEVMGSNPGEKTGFKIKTSALAFKILSEGLYSDKIRAVIRELCTNAFDAMVEAGKPSTPFKVHLPTRYEPWFSVKDEGVGMDHDRVMQNYCTYFGSSKNDTNDQVGCLGLGSKSPFAYTETFSVTSIKDGLKRTYTALVSDEGYPEVLPIPLAQGDDEEPIYAVETDECNGVEVTFPVQENHISEFSQKAKVVLLDFPVKPTLNYDIHVGTIDYSMRKPTWAMRKPSNDLNYYTKVRVIQGCVGYPLDSNQIGFSHPLLNSDIDLFVQIGDVEITPSRESLSYTEYTRKNLKAALEIVAAEIAEGYVEKINTCKCRMEALVTLTQLRAQNSDLFRAVEKNIFGFGYDNFTLTSDSISINQMDFLAIMVKTAKMKGQRVDQENMFATKEARKEQMVKRAEAATKGSSFYATLTEVQNLQFSRTPIIVFNDSTKSIRACLERAWYDEFQGAPVYIVEPSKDASLEGGVQSWTPDGDAEVTAELFAAEFDQPLVRMSELFVKYPAPKREKVNKKTTRIRYFWQNRRSNGEHWWRCTGDDIEKQLTDREGLLKYWVNLFDGKVSETLSTREHKLHDGTKETRPYVQITDNQEVGTFMNQCRAAKILDRDIVLFGVPERELPQVVDNEEWANLVEFAKEYMTHLTDEETNQLIVLNHAGRFESLKQVSAIITRLKGTKLSEKGQEFDSFLKICTKFQEWNNSLKSRTEALNQLRTKFDLPTPAFPEAIESFLASIKSQYPLLIELAKVAQQDVITQYVYLVEERDSLAEQVTKLQPQIFPEEETVEEVTEVVPEEDEAVA